MKQENLNKTVSINYKYIKYTVAFTLSEVLITLGIIGIVAAMTLPTLVANYQKYILKNQLKKVYNTYTDAVQRVSYNYGELPACWYGDTWDWSECTAFYSALAKELNAVKYCENNALAKGCVPKYFKYPPAENNTNCPGFSEPAVNKSSRAWVLADGSIMFTYAYGPSAPVFGVDVNGLKKPNMGGYDLFIMKLENKSGFHQLTFHNTCGFDSPGGIHTREELYNYIYE